MCKPGETCFYPFHINIFSTPSSGKERVLPPSPPLRTGHESFPSSGSSLPNGHRWTRFHEGALPVLPLRYALGVDVHFGLPCASLWHTSPPFCIRLHQQSLPSSAFPSCRFAKLSRNGRPGGSLPTFVEDDIAALQAQSLFIPLQDDFCFFRFPLPTIPLMSLAVLYLLWRRIMGLPRFSYVTKTG